MLAYLWPRSLRGQVLLAMALALFLAQGISALALYRAQQGRVEGAVIHTAAFRLAVAARGGADDDGDARVPWRTMHRHSDAPMLGGHRGFDPRASGGPPLPPELEAERGAPRPGRIEHAAASPVRAGETREAAKEQEIRQLLGEQDVPVSEVVVVRRAIAGDQTARLRRAAWRARNPGAAPPRDVMIAAIRLQTPSPGTPQWIVSRTLVPQTEKLLLRTIALQTALTYLLLVGAMWWLLRRITRPLAALTTRLERFAETRTIDGQLAPEGPDDVARLISAHNAMEARIAALLDEKDVMLGAIGHDLKTPLAALRVRIESVEDETERGRMAATIEDITRSLDDILSLARVGRPSDPREVTELSALVAAVVEEYEDMGEPVELGDTVRAVLPLRPTWIRRALRNLIGNALRYGSTARISLGRESSGGSQRAVIRIADDGPGIPEDQISTMLEAFTRGDPSRNSETGGAGLGLTLARAIAEQHGGTLALINRHQADGTVSGLDAVLILPLG